MEEGQTLSDLEGRRTLLHVPKGLATSFQQRQNFKYCLQSDDRIMCLLGQEDSIFQEILEEVGEKMVIAILVRLNFKAFKMNLKLNEEILTEE